MSREYRVEKVEGDAILKVRKKVPWNKIKSLLIEGFEVFVECDRRTAYYIRKKLEKELKIQIESYPSLYKGMSGYVFKIALVHEFLKRSLTK